MVSFFLSSDGRLHLLGLRMRFGVLHPLPDPLDYHAADDAGSVEQLGRLEWGARWRHSSLYYVANLIEYARDGDLVSSQGHDKRIKAGRQCVGWHFTAARPTIRADFSTEDPRAFREPIRDVCEHLEIEGSLRFIDRRTQLPGVIAGFLQSDCRRVFRGHRGAP
jgi:hypothetical protein